jgi:protein-L-isoaspartate O-methyltransferase
LLGYIGASRDLISWIDGARAFALLSGAVDSGILNALHEKSTPERIASTTNVDLQRVVDLCLALEAHGVVVQEREYYQLTPDFARLASPTAAVPLTTVIRQAMVMIHALQTMSPSGPGYTAMPSEDILAMAEGAGISALSSSPHVSSGATGQMIPEVEALWQVGAHHLEVGCGIGNALLGTAATYPKVIAIGIEIDGPTAAEAERRADLLGLTDRVEVRRMDARELQDEEVYDTVQWSQFFFPAATRPIVLAAMLRALKPGGYLFMPWFGSLSGDPSAHRTEMLRMAVRALKSGGTSFLSYMNDVLRDTPGRRKKERRLAALLKMLFNKWGVPVRTAAELAAEVEGSGFRVLRTLHTPVNQFALTRGFLLAQREAHQV